MKFVNIDNRIPIKSWCEPIEDGAMQQATNLANHPCMFRHIALMPDCHQGYGMPIGGVIACNNAVIPNAVGVDIGCGMCAVRTSTLVEELNTDAVKRIMRNVRKTVPVGFNHHDIPQDWPGFAEAPDIPVVIQQLDSARKQLGTLGGGNHFIEIQAGDDGFVWLMLHSGSRNFGYKIAKEYNEKAQKLCALWHSKVDNFNGMEGLAFLPIGTQEAREYIVAMNFALRFAQASRAAMMLSFKEAVYAETSCSFDEEINIHHNYAAIENHFGHNVWVHRKGATSAREGQAGIIPGSMGTASYIVRGLGNPESFMSCSHGAGRCMGRKEASRILTVAECDKAMEGVVYDWWGTDRKGNVDLGEAPGAYKNIDTVIEAQADLVDVVVKLRPLGVVKS
jgi:tRNA-splicing ligase RtcB